MVGPQWPQSNGLMPYMAAFKCSCTPYAQERKPTDHKLANPFTAYIHTCNVGFSLLISSKAAPEPLHWRSRECGLVLFYWGENLPPHIHTPWTLICLCTLLDCSHRTKHNGFFFLIYTIWFPFSLAKPIPQNAGEGVGEETASRISLDIFPISYCALMNSPFLRRCLQCPCIPEGQWMKYSINKAWKWEWVWFLWLVWFKKEHFLFRVYFCRNQSTLVQYTSYY